MAKKSQNAIWFKSLVVSGHRDVSFVPFFLFPTVEMDKVYYEKWNHNTFIKLDIYIHVNLWWNETVCN